MFLQDTKNNVNAQRLRFSFCIHFVPSLLEHPPFFGKMCNGCHISSGKFQCDAPSGLPGPFKKNARRFLLEGANLKVNYFLSHLCQSVVRQTCADIGVS